MYNHIMPYWSAFPQQTCPYYYSPYAQQHAVIPHHVFLQHATIPHNAALQFFESRIDAHNKRVMELKQQYTDGPPVGATLYAQLSDGREVPLINSTIFPGAGYPKETYAIDSIFLDQQQFIGLYPHITGTILAIDNIHYQQHQEKMKSRAQEYQRDHLAAVEKEKAVCEQSGCDMLIIDRAIMDDGRHLELALSTIYEQEKTKKICVETRFLSNDLQELGTLCSRVKEITRNIMQSPSYLNRDLLPAPATQTQYLSDFQRYIKQLHSKGTAYGRTGRFEQSKANNMIVIQKGVLYNGQEIELSRATIIRNEDNSVDVSIEAVENLAAIYPQVEYLLPHQIHSNVDLHSAQAGCIGETTSDQSSQRTMEEDEVQVEEVDDEESPQAAWNPARCVPEPAPAVLPEKLDPQSPAGRLDRAIQCALGKTQKQLEEDVHYTTDRPCKYAAAVWIADKEDQSSYNSDRHTLLFLSVGDKDSNGHITFRNIVDNTRRIEQLLTEGNGIKAKDIELTQKQIAEISRNAQQI